MIIQRNGRVILKTSTQEVWIETTLKTEEGTFHLDVLQVTSDLQSSKIDWVHESLGILEQYFVLIDEGFYHVRFNVVPLNEVKGILRQSYGVMSKEKPYVMIPGCLYGSNNFSHSKGVQPTLDYRQSKPYYYTRADRSTHNAVLLQNESGIVGIRIDEATKTQYNGIGIDTNPSDEIDRLVVSIGYEHLPDHYVGKLKEHSIKESGPHYQMFKPNEVVGVNGHLYFSDSFEPFGYEAVIKSFYDIKHEPPTPFTSVLHGRELLVGALVNSYDMKNHYFPTYTNSESGDTAWTGGMQVIYPLVASAHSTPEVKEIVFDYVNELLTNGFSSEANLFYESKRETWQVSGWWKESLPYDDAFSAYVNGQAITYLLKIHPYYKELQETILNVCKKALNHVISLQREDGSFPSYYHKDTGEALDHVSFAGAWMFAAISEFAWITKEKKFIDSARHAYEYYKDLLRTKELYGMPIDTFDAVDEEGNLAFITGLKTFHQLTGEEEVLDTLIHALHYEFSWKFSYNTKFKNDPLKSNGFSTCGGSITSSHNIHIHPMGNLVVDEMYYVYKFTGDLYILSRMEDTILWGLNTFNTENLEFGFGEPGQSTEQFFHTDGIQDDMNRLSDGGIWPDYLPWAAACVLLSLKRDYLKDCVKINVT